MFTRIKETTKREKPFLKQGSQIGGGTGLTLGFAAFLLLYIDTYECNLGNAILANAANFNCTATGNSCGHFINVVSNQIDIHCNATQNVKELRYHYSTDSYPSTLENLSYFLMMFGSGAAGALVFFLLALLYKMARPSNHEPLLENNEDHQQPSCWSRLRLWRPSSNPQRPPLIELHPPSVPPMSYGSINND